MYQLISQNKQKTLYIIVFTFLVSFLVLLTVVYKRDEKIIKKSKSIEIYSFAHEFCKMRGMIIADTKFEFGFIDGKLSLIDEVLTPDSSRFWDSNGYVPGTSPPPYDKQYLRNWLSEQDWNKEPPAPHLPTDVIDMTFEKYNDCLDRITGIKLKINE